MAVVPGLARAKLEVILTGPAGHDWCLVARRASDLRLRTGLRASRAGTKAQGHDRYPQACKSEPSPDVSQFSLHIPLHQTRPSDQRRSRQERRHAAIRPALIGLAARSYQLRLLPGGKCSAALLDFVLCGIFATSARPRVKHGPHTAKCRRFAGFGRRFLEAARRCASIGSIMSRRCGS